MSRYHDDVSGMAFDSRQDCDEFACAECGEVYLADFLEPCPAGVALVKGAVCSWCAMALRPQSHERSAAE